MKRVHRTDFAGIDFLGTLPELELTDGATLDGVVERFKATLEGNVGSARALRGHRVQKMFAYVAASLGEVVMVKEEDVGEMYLPDNVAIPDLRLILIDGSQLLVEVKSTLKDSARLKRRYLEQLSNYGALVGCPVMLAHYWSGWNLWMLASVDRILEDRRETIRFKMPDFMFLNEMSRLGDAMVGTRAPLTLRVVAAEPRPMVPSAFVLEAGGAEGSEVAFTIGDVSVLCAGEEITDPEERSIASSLMFFGDWQGTSERFDVDADGRLLSISMDLFPGESAADRQGFDFIGVLSSIISGRYNEATTTEGVVRRLAIGADVGALAVKIPPDYSGKDLPLWIMRQDASETGWPPASSSSA